LSDGVAFAGRLAIHLNPSRRLAHTPIAVGLLLAWCGFLFFYGLSAGPFYRTEALRAIIGAEALNGQWLVPTLYGEPYLTKPPGMYVAIAITSWPFGEVSEASARLPSAIAATVTVLCFYWTLRRGVGGAEALLGGLLLPMSFLWLDKAPSAEIDMLQMMWVALALLCFFRALEIEETQRASRVPLVPTLCVGTSASDALPPASNRSETAVLDAERRKVRSHAERGNEAIGWWIAALLAVTAGFLTKWTAPAFFYGALVPLLMWRRRVCLLWSWPHLLGVAISITLVAAWACAVAAQTSWPLLIDTVEREALQRFGGEGKSLPSWKAGSFPLIVVAAVLPLSALALLTLRRSFFLLWDDRGRRFLQFLHCWTWPNLLFWTFATQHNVRYCLPMIPGLVGLGVIVCIAWQRGMLRWPLRCLQPRSALIALVLLWMLTKIAFVELIVPSRTANRHARETAAELKTLVPENHILYLRHLKDEGIMFYYGRPVRKLAVAPRHEGVHAVLTKAEWEDRDRFGRVQPIHWFRDQQGDRFVLALVSSGKPR
jgi:4-amino-4-deoxy-L-arabinose transferase-like glycosyltransferase